MASLGFPQHLRYLTQQLLSTSCSLLLSLSYIDLYRHPVVAAIPSITMTSCLPSHLLADLNSRLVPPHHSPLLDHRLFHGIIAADATQTVAFKIWMRFSSLAPTANCYYTWMLSMVKLICILRQYLLRINYYYFLGYDFGPQPTS